jgi:hypothetical protein
MPFRRLLGMLVTLSACGGAQAQPKTVTASDFRLSDGKLTRASLALEKGSPVFALFDERGRAMLRTSLDESGRPSLSLYPSEDPSKAVAVVEADEKGAHVLFRGPGKQESYLFQKSDGTAGIVLVDANGTHRGELKLAPSGDVELTLFDATGKPAFGTTVSRTGAVQHTPGG